MWRIWRVRMVYVAITSSLSNVTWIHPYVSDPFLGQYISHFFCKREKITVTKYKINGRERNYNDTHATTFNEIRNHNDDRHPLLPHHPPESVESRWQRTLRTDVRASTLPAIYVIRVHVIVTLLRRSSAARQQLNSRVIICEQRFFLLNI